MINAPAVDVSITGQCIKVAVDGTVSKISTNEMRAEIGEYSVECWSCGALADGLDDNGDFDIPDGWGSLTCSIQTMMVYPDDKQLPYNAMFQRVSGSLYILFEYEQEDASYSGIAPPRELMPTFVDAFLDKLDSGFDIGFTRGEPGAKRIFSAIYDTV